MSQQSNPATLREALELAFYFAELHVPSKEGYCAKCGFCHCDRSHVLAMAKQGVLAALAASGTHSLPPQGGQHHGDRIKATEMRAALISAMVCDTCIGQRQISNECESCLVGDGTRPCTCDEMPIFDCPQCDGRGWVHREPEKFKELCQQLYDTELNYLPDRTKATEHAVAMHESASQGLQKASPEGEGREANQQRVDAAAQRVRQAMDYRKYLPSDPFRKDVELLIEIALAPVLEIFAAAQPQRESEGLEKFKGLAKEFRREAAHWKKLDTSIAKTRQDAFNECASDIEAAVKALEHERESARTEQARPLIERLDGALRNAVAVLEYHHTSRPDERTALEIRLAKGIINSDALRAALSPQTDSQVPR